MSRDAHPGEKHDLLLYKNGYWTGSDGQIRLELPNALFQKPYKAELAEQGGALYTEEDAGWRATIFQQCRKISYWRLVSDPNLLRTPLSGEEPRQPEDQQAD